jgi:hypothetical protein
MSAQPSLRDRLKLRTFQSENLLTVGHSQAVGLLKSAGIRPGDIRRHARRLLASGAVAVQAALMAASDSPLVSSLDLQHTLIEQLKNILPPQPDPLNPTQEEQIRELLHQIYGIRAVAELEGNRLNRSYGLIGAEQHLPRYPGDSVGQHDAVQQSGITPGKGAWGYFAYSRDQLTADLIAKEKYYVAVQTLYLPDWSTRLAYLRDWYKYRKVAVINPQNGKLVIAVIADSGPAAWTGKHFGGSPEVMDYLQMKDGKQRGSVILFFIDDPADQIPLGPMEYNLEKGPPLLAS